MSSAAVVIGTLRIKVNENFLGDAAIIFITAFILSGDLLFKGRICYTRSTFCPLSPVWQVGVDDLNGLDKLTNLFSFIYLFIFFF